MNTIDRRQMLKVTGAGALGTVAAACADASTTKTLDDSERVGVLVDTTECIGCRKCEFACAQSNELTHLPLDAYEDASVFGQTRRMVADAYTVVNRYPNPDNPLKPTYVKIQCMHCKRPACVSACIVGALHAEPNGSVSYDAWKCIGCRYCMMACPFEVPAYEYANVLTPVVSKCNFCFDKLQSEGKAPACVAICPPMCLTFAKRDALLELAREKIAAAPEKYNDHIYGEHEGGGTAWLYLTPRPAEEYGFQKLPDRAVPDLTETLQHNIFKFGIPPLMLFGVLSIAKMALAERTGTRDDAAPDSREE